MYQLLFPSAIREDLHGYGWKPFARDAQAGLTVAVFAAPQGVAYALLAGVPPVHGLYAALVMSVVAALWGSSRFVNTGPTNSAALLTAVALLPWAGSPDFLRVCFALTLLVIAVVYRLVILRPPRWLENATLEAGLARIGHALRGGRTGTA